MPARNSARTIDHAISSTVQQLSATSEVLVANDGSVDATGLVLAGWSRDPRVRVTTHASSRGVAESLNLLLAASVHETVARMDADDVSFPGRFRAEMGALASGAADVVFSSVVRFGSDFRSLRPSPLAPLDENGWRLALLLGNPGAHSTMLAKRELLIGAGGYRRTLAEDYDLWLRLAASGARFRRLARPLVGLRQHSAQVTRSETWRTRAAQETEWQDSYWSLARLLIEDCISPPPSGTSASPAGFALRLGPQFVELLRNTAPRNRPGLALMMRRAGVRVSGAHLVPFSERWRDF